MLLKCPHFADPQRDMDQDLTYDHAASHIETVLITGKRFKADVFVVLSRGHRFVVKDFTAKGRVERNLVGRLLISREVRAYQALAGIEGLPSRFKRLSPFALAIEYLDGRDLGRVERGEIGPGVIRQFERIVEDLHERGWVHLDLQRRSNILMVNGAVYIVDLASAFHPGGVPFVGRCLTRLMSLADRFSLIKIKNIFAPEQMTEKERKWLKFRNRFMPNTW